MNNEKFTVLLTLIVPQVVKLIAERHSCEEMTAADNFYKSKVYVLLEEESTKVWHFSPLTLFHMYDEEVRTGTFVIPEET